MLDCTVLVNRDNPLPDGFVPENMIRIDEPMSPKLDPTYFNQLDYRAYHAFKEMQSAALEQGLEIFVESSYRSFQYQQALINDCLQRRGPEFVAKYQAPAGCSEHQTGLAMDLTYRRDGVVALKKFPDAPELQWAAANSYKFGFILRYPQGKEKITGFGFEPWHFRYVGKELAKKIFTSGITLEEYYMKKNSIC